MSSVITPLDFDSDNISLIQISRLHNYVLFAIFFLSGSQKWILISKLLLTTC